MITVPLRDLRVAFLDPAGYVRKVKSSARPAMRSTKYGIFRNAVFEFHQKDQNLNQAAAYLEDKFKSFRSQAELPKYIDWLDVYAKEFKSLDTKVVQTRANVQVPLPDQYAGVRVSGQVARIDLNPSGGYNAWVFVRDEPEWAVDPRMPLLQDVVANKLAAELDEVEVGVYDFVRGKHLVAQFDGLQVKAARKQLINLLRLFRK
jgi:hypothetical protein